MFLIATPLPLHHLPPLSCFIFLRRSTGILSRAAMKVVWVGCLAKGPSTDPGSAHQAVCPATG